jgi:cytochrome c biogenesis protein CcdA
VEAVSLARFGGRSAGRPRSVRGSLLSIVFGFEIVVVFLGALVAFGLDALEPSVAFIGGGVLVAVMIVTLGLVQFRAGVILGTLVQAAIVASGFLVPVMFFIGGTFAAVWVYCLVVGTGIDRRNAATETGTEI